MSGNFNLADLLKDNTFERKIIIEVLIKLELEGFDWIKDGETVAYKLILDPSVYGIIRYVQENGTDYSAKSTIQECRDTASSWYYDFSNKTLYVHTSTGESPAERIGNDYKFCLLAGMALGFTANQPDVNRAIYPIMGSGCDVYYLPYLSQDTVSEISETIGDFFTGTVEYSSGTINFINPAWFYWAFRVFIWISGFVYVIVGVDGVNYSDFIKVGAGIINGCSVSDSGASISMADFRQFYLSKAVPNQYFSATTYPNLDPSSINLPIPLVFGKCKNVPCVCIDYVNLKYKITNYEIHSVLNVYKGDFVLTAGADYTVDLTNAEITLMNDPGNLLITADVEGIQVSETENNYHEDSAHTDEAHSDAYSDVAHEDVAHTDAYSDVAHSDVAHSDVAHTDSYSDHYDSSHEDIV